MCVVSMVIDHYRDKWQPMYPSQPFQPLNPIQPNDFTINITQPISREEFDSLKRDVEEMKKLLIRAKDYDEKNGEPDCEMDEKVALVKKMAELVGVDLSDVLK